MLYKWLSGGGGGVGGGATSNNEHCIAHPHKCVHYIYSLIVRATSERWGEENGTALTKENGDLKEENGDTKKENGNGHVDSKTEEETVGPFPPQHCSQHDQDKDSSTEDDISSKKKKLIDNLYTLYTTYPTFSVLPD